MPLRLAYLRLAKMVSDFHQRRLASLTDLALRGLLLADGATRMSKHEEYYFTTSSFDQLMERARAQIKAVG